MIRCLIAAKQNEHPLFKRRRGGEGSYLLLTPGSLSFPVRPPLFVLAAERWNDGLRFVLFFYVHPAIWPITGSNIKQGRTSQFFFGPVVPPSFLAFSLVCLCTFSLLKFNSEFVLLSFYFGLLSFVRGLVFFTLFLCGRNVLTTCSKLVLRAVTALSLFLSNSRRAVPSFFPLQAAYFLPQSIFWPPAHKFCRRRKRSAFWSYLRNKKWVSSMMKPPKTNVLCGIVVA